MANLQSSGRAVSDDLFTSLLESAYSLQQRHDRIKSRVSASKSDDLISAVQDIQDLVWHRAIHPDTAIHLIANRTEKLSGAGGVAIALIDGENLEYKVATGIATRLLGFRILSDASSSFQELRTQQMVESDTWRDNTLRTRVTAKSILSIPIHRKGTLAGCIQLFSRLGQFGEESIYTCELMSGVLSQLMEETDFPNVSEERIGVIPDSTEEIESRSQESPVEQIGKAGSSPKADEPFPALEPLKIEHPRSTDTVRIRGNETWEEAVPWKQKLPWPSAERKPLAGAYDQTLDSEIEKLPVVSARRDLTNTRQNMQEMRTGRGADLSIGSADTNVYGGQTLSLQENGDDSNRSFQVEVSRQGMWTRVSTMIYPVLVALFAGIANMRGWARGWPLQLATVIIVAFTTAELTKRWLKPQ